MTIIQNPPGLAAPLEPLIFPSSCWGFPWMPGMPSVLEDLYVDPPCRFVFWYIEPYVVSRPWQYLTILALYTRYPTFPDPSSISLRWSVMVYRPLECLLANSVYRVKQQRLYSLASGNIGVEVPLEGGCNMTDEFGWHLHQTARILNTQGFVRLEKTVVNGGGNVAANVWLLASLRTTISMIPPSGRMIPACMSFFSKIYRSSSSNQRTLHFFLEASISKSW